MNQIDRDLHMKVYRLIEKNYTPLDTAHMVWEKIKSHFTEDRETRIIMTSRIGRWIEWEECNYDE